jgi:hypothetical protein
MDNKIDLSSITCELTAADLLEKNKSDDKSEDKFDDKSEDKSVDKSVDKSEDKSFNKPKRMRCHLCNKKLKMIHFTCKCEYNFCINHHNPHTHNCLYDYKKEREKEIEKNNPKLGCKLEKI